MKNNFFARVTHLSQKVYKHFAEVLKNQNFANYGISYVICLFV